VGHVTEAAGIEVILFDSRNESALAGTSCLVEDRPQKSGLIQKHSLTELAPGGSTQQ